MAINTIEELRSEILEWHNEGYSVEVIAGEVGINQVTVEKTIKAYALKEQAQVQEDTEARSKRNKAILTWGFRGVLLCVGIVGI